MGIALWLGEGKALLKRAEDAEMRERRERVARECDAKHLQDRHDEEIERFQGVISRLENLNERLLQQIGIEPLEPTSVIENESTGSNSIQVEQEPASPTARIIQRDRKRKEELRTLRMAEDAEWRARAEQVAREQAEAQKPVM